MWKLFFEICDFLCVLIPNKKLRDKIRTENLYDWKNKYKALKEKYPALDFRKTKMIKGGWNIGFIVDKKYVFKIRKSFDNSLPTDKIEREKRITDAFADISPLRIPKIEIIKAGKYVFFKYDFIPGKNLNTFSSHKIKQNKEKWGKQLAEFIYAIHNHNPKEINDLKDKNIGDGWNHNDICNNIIVDKKTMNIMGIIDWEYSGWGLLETEFINCVKFSKKITDSGILPIIKHKYKKLYTTNKRT